MGKQRAIKLNLNRTFEEKDFPCDRNVITDQKGRVIKREIGKIEFEPAMVFSEIKPRWRFWRTARNLILFVDGAKKALQFSKVTKEMMPFWTKKEAKEFVNKEIAKSLTRFKALTIWEFIIILILLIVIIIISLKGALTIGAF